MSKKTFSGGLSSLLGEKTKRVGSVAKKPAEKITKNSSKEGSRKGCLPGETRAAFIVKEDLLEKLKAVAYWERTMIKEVIASALQEYVERYEKKKGTIKNPPKK